jgi:hypothetical protein
VVDGSAQSEPFTWTADADRPFENSIESTERGSNLQQEAVMRKLPKRSAAFVEGVEGATVTIDQLRSLYNNVIYQDCLFNGDLYGQPIWLKQCRFYKRKFGGISNTRFKNASFQECEIIECDFYLVEMIEVLFEDCHFLRDNFNYGTIFTKTRLIRPRGLETNVNLHFVRNDQGEAELDEDLRHAPLPPFEKHASWERLRTFGQLPLFGVSFSVLVAIPVVAFLIGTYNEQVERLQELTSNDAEKLPPKAASLLEQLVYNLHPIPIPNLSFWLLISTVFLGTASMLYAIVCPPRVKEFSLERWTNEIGRSALHYLPLSWRHRWVRVVAFVCYLIGGFGTLLILIVKLVNAGKFIFAHATLPWWQW